MPALVFIDTFDDGNHDGWTAETFNASVTPAAQAVTLWSSTPGVWFGAAALRRDLSVQGDLSVSVDLTNNTSNGMGVRQALQLDFASGTVTLGDTPWADTFDASGPNGVWIQGDPTGTAGDPGVMHMLNVARTDNLFTFRVNGVLLGQADCGWLGDLQTVRLRAEHMSSTGDVDFHATLDNVRVETIETTLYWIAPGGGDWHDGANWSLGRPPRAHEDAVIDRPGATVTVTAGSAAVARSLTASANLVVNGSLTLGASSLLANLNLGGLIEIAQGDTEVGNLTVLNNSTIQGGKLAIDRLRVQGNATLTNTELTVRVRGDWTAGRIDLTHGTKIINLGTFEVNGDFYMNGTGDFDNHGTLRKTDGTGELQINLAHFNNRSRLEIQKGSVLLTSEGKHQGTFDIAQDSTLRFGEWHTIDSGTTFVGDGWVRLRTDASWSVPGSITVTNLVNEAAIIQGTPRENPANYVDSIGGTVLVNGEFRWLRGNLKQVTVAIASTAVANLPNTTLVRTLTGANLLSQGVVNWHGGNIKLERHNYNQIINPGPNQYTVPRFIPAVLGNDGINGKGIFNIRNRTGQILTDNPQLDSAATVQPAANHISVVNGGWFGHPEVPADNDLTTIGVTIRNVRATVALDHLDAYSYYQEGGTGIVRGGIAKVQKWVDLFSGSLRIASTANLSVVEGAVVATSGRIVLDHGSINARDGVVLDSAATLEGIGAIFAAVHNYGVIEVGFPVSTGRLIIHGNFTQYASPSAGTPAGELRFEAHGTQPITGFDQLVVNGTATLAGKVEITALDDWTPSAGDILALINATNIQGQFDSVTGLETFGNPAVTTQATATSFRLKR